ncbi:MAG: DedA family protein [Fimbriiglobus sp.]
MFDWVTLTKYGGVASALILSGFGAPIPEEVPIVTAGAMVGHDAQLSNVDLLYGSVMGGYGTQLAPPRSADTRWWIMLPVCIIAVVIGDSVLFIIGRIWGARLIRSAWVQRNILPLDKQQKIEANFHKNGIMILLGARLTPGIRTPVFIMAGVLRMPIQRFLLADALYAIPGVNLFFWLAYWFTDQFQEAITRVERHRPMVIMAVLAGILGIALYKFLASRKLSTGDVSEIPAYAKPVGVVTHAIEQTIEKSVVKTLETTAAVVDKVTHPMGRKHPEEPVEPKPSTGPQDHSGS